MEPPSKRPRFTAVLPKTHRAINYIAAQLRLQGIIGRKCDSKDKQNFFNTSDKLNSEFSIMKIKAEELSSKMEELRTDSTNAIQAATKLISQAAQEKQNFSNAFSKFESEFSIMKSKAEEQSSQIEELRKDGKNAVLAATQIISQATEEKLEHVRKECSSIRENLEERTTRLLDVVEAEKEFVRKECGSLREKLESEAAEIDEEFDEVHKELINLDVNMIALKDSVQTALDHITGGRIRIEVKEDG